MFIFSVCTCRVTIFPVVLELAGILLAIMLGFFDSVALLAGLGTTCNAFDDVYKSIGAEPLS